MTVLGELLKASGIHKMPWVVRAYLTLIGLLVILILIAQLKPDTQIANSIMSIAAESFKIVLGAFVGSLSMAASRQFGPPNNQQK
jgi:NAD/NADP transhydrogenase beta subunit